MPRVLQRVAVGCTVLAGLVLSAQFVLAALRSVGLAWPITHPEGATIAAMLRVRDGEPLYHNFQQFPFIITPYPPIQPVVVGELSRLLGLSVLETAGLARTLTLAASLAATFLIWLIARRLGAGRLAALAGAGLLLPLPFLDEWGFAARPDVPAVMLSLLAMLLLIWHPQRLWLGAIVAVLAMFTKQTSVALPAAATLWLLLDGRWRAAATFAGLWVVLIAATAGLLEAVTAGTFILNTVLAHVYTPKNGFDFALRDIQPLFQDGWLPIGLAILAAILAALVPGLRRRATLPLLYFATSTGLALYSLRNTGGDVNYLIEPAAAACVPAALAIDWLWRRDRAPTAMLNLVRPLATVALAGAAVIWAAGLWDFWRLDGGIEPTSRLPLSEIAAADTVLSEEPLAVLLAGRPLLVSDTYHLSMLTTGGFFDPTDLERRIKRGELDLIVMRSDVRAARFWKRQPLLPEAVRLAIKDNYHQAGRVGMFWLYKPEDR